MYLRFYDSWKVYGQFDTGTNLVTQLLRSNCVYRLKVMYQHRVPSINGHISNWKHRFFNNS